MKQIKVPAYNFQPPAQAVRTCRTVRRLAIWSVLLCAVGQLLIDASGINVISGLIVATMSAVTFHFVIRGDVFRVLPLPALIVLGFNVSAMSGALIAQTLTLQSLVYNLQVPLITFALCALFQISLLTALFIFLRSSSLRSEIRTINRRVFSRMGIMQTPSPLQLWIMGLLGSAAMLGSALGENSSALEYGDVGGKFIAGLSYLAFAPFIVPILDKIFNFSRASSTAKSSKWLLISYTVLLGFIGIVSNSRGTLVMGIANLGIATFLLMLLGQLRVTARLRRGLVVGVAVVLVIAPMMADLAIAMVVVRGERGEVSGTRLVALTLAAFKDKPELERYRTAARIITGGGEYDENYLANPFIARFVNTKFFDNTLSYADVRTGAHADKLWGVTFDKIGALLPTPVLGGLGIGISKANLEFSMGDALYNAQTGAALGGYKTGSPVGHGMSLMGPLVFIAAVPLFLLAFMAVQSLTLTVGSFVVISPVILLQLMSIYGLAAGDSLLDPIGLMLRTLPQNILIYWVVFQSTRWVSEPRQRRRGAERPREPFGTVQGIGDSNAVVPRRFNT